MSEQQTDFQAWIGKQESRVEQASAAPYSGMAALLDRPCELPEPGTVLPPVWHWLYFLPHFRQSELDVDGHVSRGGFLPPIELPRRMWAGSDLTFHRPVQVGDLLRKNSEIVSIKEKNGRSGRLFFVRVLYTFFCNDDASPAISEYQDVVYREAADPSAAKPAATMAPTNADWFRDVLPDTVKLFRYSALTFNGHRIHYDRPYAMDVEGYPGLVVHGPYLATLVMDAVRHQLPESVVTTFSFQARQPLFDHDQIKICAKRNDADNGLDMWVQNASGELCLKAQVGLDR